MRRKKERKDYKVIGKEAEREGNNKFNRKTFEKKNKSKKNKTIKENKKRRRTKRREEERGVLQIEDDKEK